MTINRRTTMTAIATAPLIAVLPDFLYADTKPDKSELEVKYAEWLDARRDIDEAFGLYTADQMTAEIEDEVFEPLHQRAETIEAAIVNAPCLTASDLSVKLLTVMRMHCESYSEKDMDRLLLDAQSLVNLASAEKKKLT